ncbi:MAG: FAD-binding oxidoreductase [Deltaproteobacteria bacterium]|nr:MAG: FAD-binding oxidoreductase [Deltaproteobacteria bacterium]
MIPAFEAAAAHEPASVAEAARVMEQLAREGRRVGFVGGGTELELGALPERIDAVVRTRGLRRIVEYQPADMVMVVEAGVTLAEIQAAAREHRQRLALDPPWPDRATIGGIVATGAFGPRRARYGAVRDLIIGVQLVRADGAIAHGGGKVVKNVAGFDLPKLACGSLGTLGLIAVANFRLHPLPEASETVLARGLSAADVTKTMLRLREAQLEAVALCALRAGQGFDLALRFEGFGKGVEQQVARLLQMVKASRGEEGFWARHDQVRTGGPLRVKVAALPTDLAEVDKLLAPLGAAFAWYPSLGLGFASGPAPGQAASVLADARAGLVRRGGSLVVQAAPAEIRARVDPWGPPPPSFALLQRMKDNFDPGHRLNPGRFVGGI